MTTKIKPVSLLRKAKAEHLNYHLEVKAFIEKCGVEKISCTDEVKLYSAAILEEIKIVNLQQASALTPEMEEKDKERGEYLSFLFATINAAKKSPLSAQKEAYRQIAPVVAPYHGISRSTNSQESALIIGLLADLKVETLKEHVAELNLNAVIPALYIANSEYMSLDERRISEMPAKAETEKKRKAVDECYSAIVDKVNATVILSPNAEAQALVHDINNLIDKTNAEYNRRIAKRGDEPETQELV